MTTTKMHQILAVEKDVRSTTNRRVTDAHRMLTTPALLSGLSRTYEPLVDGDVTLPPESTLAQVSATRVLNDVMKEWERLWDTVATKDFGNMSAVADITLTDGTVLASNVPATYLLWLEKEMADLHTFVSKLPVLDPSEEWAWSEEKAIYQTPPTETLRTKKVPRSFELSPATDKHPAQVEMYHEDVPVGRWSAVRFSGALPAQTVRDLLDRVNIIRDAVKQARARANETTVEQQKIAGPILSFIFEDATTS